MTNNIGKAFKILSERLKSQRGKDPNRSCVSCKYLRVKTSYNLRKSHYPIIDSWCGKSITLKDIDNFNEECKFFECREDLKEKRK